MTNKEAAVVLRDMLKFYGMMLRGNGKTDNIYTHMEALLKAINLLEKTPD